LTAQGLTDIAYTAPLTTGPLTAPRSYGILQTVKRYLENPLTIAFA
jgi:hypothetical protein